MICSSIIPVDTVSPKREVASFLVRPVKAGIEASRIYASRDHFADQNPLGTYRRAAARSWSGRFRFGRGNRCLRRIRSVAKTNNFMSYIHVA